MTKSGGDDSSGNASTASLAVRHVGQYQLLDPLGRGGMGVVYKAVHTRLKRFAAIKFIRPDLALHETVLRRFARSNCWGSAIIPTCSARMRPVNGKAQRS